MSHVNGSPNPQGSLNSSITGTSPFLGGERPPAYQPVEDSWQPNQYYRGPAQPVPAAQGPAPTSAPAHGTAPVYPAPQAYPTAPVYPNAAAPGTAPVYGAQPGSGPGHYGHGPYRPPAPANTLAPIALVASFIFSIVGVVLGHIALNQIKHQGETGRGMAIAALVIGYVQVVLVVGFFFIAVVLAANSG